MSDFTKILYLLLALSFFSCKKKVEKEIVANPVDQPSAVEIYGSFYSEFHIQKISFSPNDTCRFYFSATFLKSPDNELTDYPNISGVQCNSYGLTGNGSGLYTLDTEVNEPNTFQNLNISFSSPSLGGQNLIQDQESLPQFTKTFGDTLVLSKSITSTFTVTNINPLGYSAAIQINNFSYNIFGWPLQQGTNSIHIQPSVLHNSAYAYMSVIFSKTKYVVSNGRTYRLIKYYYREFPVKLVN